MNIYQISKIGEVEIDAPGGWEHFKLGVNGVDGIYKTEFGIRVSFKRDIADTMLLAEGKRDYLVNGAEYIGCPYVVREWWVNA